MLLTLIYEGNCTLNIAVIEKSKFTYGMAPISPNGCAEIWNLFSSVSAWFAMSGVSWTFNGEFHIFKRTCIFYFINANAQPNLKINYETFLSGFALKKTRFVRRKWMSGKETEINKPPPRYEL